MDPAQRHGPKRFWSPLVSLLAKATPRTVERRIEQLRLDVRSIVGAFTGYAPPPFRSTREQVASATAPDPIVPRVMKVTRIDRETPDAVCVQFEALDGAPIDFVPGQFLTLLVPIDGRVHRRAYSICTPHAERQRVAVAIKRIPDGRVSTHLNERLAPGDHIEVLGPSGSFTVVTDPAVARTYVLIAGGSGITPMMAIAHAVLAGEPDSRVVLFYGNRSEHDVIFRNALHALQLANSDRFTVEHVLETPPSEWPGSTGRLDGTTLPTLLTRHGLGATDACEYLLCGPEGMMERATEVLSARGVTPERIRRERFQSAAVRSERSATAPAGAHEVIVRADAEEHRFVVDDAHTVLEAALAAGVPMPFSCTMGGCGACRVRLCEGDVEMDEPNCLTDEERMQGWVLGCSTRARSKLVLEVVR